MSEEGQVECAGEQLTGGDETQPVVPNPTADTVNLSQSIADMSLKEKANGTPRASREERYAAQVEADSRSIFVGNIAPEITPEIIDEHFKDCGIIKRITLLYDKNTGAPKGYAYVEFEDAGAQEKALDHNGSELKESKINVYKKRTNLPGYRRSLQFQRPNFYFQHPYYTYPQCGYQEMNIYAPRFDIQSNGLKEHDQSNGNFRGKHRTNHRNDSRRGKFPSSHSSGQIGTDGKNPESSSKIDATKADDEIQ